MHEISRRLLYYKRRDIQEAILASARGREVGIRYGEKGFGKRPDVLVYGNDILESVKNGATSFHLSEERWHNPLELESQMAKEELDALRLGWDLVLDIDCPYWEYSKLTTHLFISALKKHGIKSISCKFSGNKGFHIGVPFEAFPDSINNLPVKSWFPDGPKKIALYLLEYISLNMIQVKENGELIFGGVHRTTRQEISKKTGKPEEYLSAKICNKCKSRIELPESRKIEFICEKCNTRAEGDEAYMLCPKCNVLMLRFDHNTFRCRKCNSREEPREIFDPLSIVNVDTVLISSRHMFRAPYSMHEKTGLISLPINPETVLGFNKELAMPERVVPGERPVFLSAEKPGAGEALSLMVAAFDFGKENLHYNALLQSEAKSARKSSSYEELGFAIPLELFPPCIKKVLEGLEDGRKRALFVLVNFLTSVGWPDNEVESLLHEWNSRNKEPLKEALIKNQISYHKQRKKKILPPNCRSYYQDFRVCFPDALCDKIKNPVQYSKIRAFSLQGGKRKSRALSEEQKEMRRQYREKLKREKINSN